MLVLNGSKALKKNIYRPQSGFGSAGIHFDENQCNERENSALFLYQILTQLSSLSSRYNRLSF